MNDLLPLGQRHVKCRSSLAAAEHVKIHALLLPKTVAKIIILSNSFSKTQRTSLED